MKRIAHVNLGRTHLIADGIGSVIESLHREQTLRGYEVLVLDPGTDPAPGNPWQTTATAVRQLSAFRPDIVHLHSLFRPVHALLALWCRLNKTPFVVAPHGALAGGGLQRDALRKRLWIRAIDGPMLRRAPGVLCLTEQERVEVLTAVPGARTHVVPNLLSDALAVAPGNQWSGGQGDGRRRVVTLARYDVHQKGLDRIAAVAVLLADVDFVVHGTFDGNDPEGARRLIRTAPPNLAFPGLVVGAEKERSLTGADLYFQPSRWEGMSVAVLEAMRAGVPCVVSREVALTLGDGAGTVFVIPDDPMTAADVMSRALGDPKAGSSHARAAKAWVDRTTTPDSVIAALQRAYEQSAAAARWTEQRAQ